MSEDEAIAQVAADLRTPGRVKQMVRSGLYREALEMIKDPVVVNAQPIFAGCTQNDEDLAPYETYPRATPPSTQLLICYVNRFGTAHALHVDLGPAFDWERWEAPVGQPRIEWPSVKAIINATVWVGGRGSDGERIRTQGPMHLWRIAVHDDGHPVNTRPVHILQSASVALWDTAFMVLLQTLNFMSCRNVAAVTVPHDQAEQRVLDRAKIDVKHLHVWPLPQLAGVEGGVELDPIGGRFAHFGPQFPLELAAGTVNGKFYVPKGR